MNLKWNGTKDEWLEGEGDKGSNHATLGKMSPKISGDETTWV